MELIEQIENYRPYNEQETRDKSVMLDCLNAFADIFTRDNALCHMTASAWVVNESFDRVLMAYHNLYDSWSWLGGHADGEEDLLAVALREVREESGVQNVRPASEDIFSLEVLTVDGQNLERKNVLARGTDVLNAALLAHLSERDSEQILFPIGVPTEPRP